MKFKLLPILAIALLASGPLNAAPAGKAKAWDREPDSFMGLRFDKKIDAALPQCPPRTVVSKTMCYEPPYTNLYTVKGGPEIGIGYGLSAFAGGLGVETFYLTTNSDNFSALVELFTNKYGPPTRRTSEPVKTKSGSSFSNETLFWSGKKVSIVIQKYAGDINTTAATVSDLAAAEKRSAERDAKSSTNAGKL
ncbi:hypothetical protein [Pseudomonas syringae]|uniref:Uncharacterized protein n=1 Tax=Pseudomonas syringae pv. papulans TaxID=83963 RepID=A0AA43IW04_PSESX|nr:hypothetical protein [Pseudomonas syringae]KWS33162.1 hypothetical protein AL059_12095 [Pseudomonas syringae pv. papulans]MDH4604606.1 hypothetical protein [Pseudomonas syringae pv. papulans]MDH4623809.1 hypothetical protein [Pseudomonas syringae pv. papulans]RMV50000.1 hypothetical protein ALP11_00253 [Pseudomonas syringae pv. papulans]